VAAQQSLGGELIMPPCRVVLSDNQTLFLQSLKKNLEEIPDLEVIGQVVTEKDLLDFVEKSTPDLVILDVGNLQQIEIVRQIKRSYPKTKILILTMEKSKNLLLQAILANTDGYMLKENTYSDLITAIQIIRQGGNYFCNIITAKMADIIRDEFTHKVSIKPLSHMQQKVLILRCESKSYKEIADLLSLSYNTVRNYMVTIKSKLNLRTQSDLMKYAIEQGYISQIITGNER
jgi:DNA-binding NarL/FixJ family response regulator